MNKLLKVSLVAVLASTTLAGCGGTGDKKADCKIKVGFVTDIGGIDDKSFNQSSWEGVKNFATNNNIDESCIDYVESKAESDYVTNLSTMAENGNNLVVAAGFYFEKSMGEVSVKFPETKFFVIDTVVPKSNVVSGVFAAEQSSYLAGVAAALQTKADGGNTVGFMGGAVSEIIGTFQAGFEQGVASVDKDMKILVDYAAGFDDTAGGATIAQKQYNAGAKVIYHAAGNSGNGVIKEAVERSKKGDKVWVIGVDRDQYKDGVYDDKSVILTSALKRVDIAVETVAKSVLDNKFAGGSTINFDIVSDGVGFPKENKNLSDDIQKKLEAVTKDMKDGKIEISKTPVIKNGSSNK